MNKGDDPLLWEEQRQKRAKASFEKWKRDMSASYSARLDTLTCNRTKELHGKKKADRYAWRVFSKYDACIWPRRKVREMSGKRRTAARWRWLDNVVNGWCNRGKPEYAGLRKEMKAWERIRTVLCKEALFVEREDLQDYETLLDEFITSAQEEVLILDREERYGTE